MLKGVHPLTSALNKVTGPFMYKQLVVLEFFLLMVVMRLELAYEVFLLCFHFSV